MSRKPLITDRLRNQIRASILAGLTLGIAGCVLITFLDGCTR